MLNTINFSKSQHYNPFAYIHSEKDILKLVTTLIANTKGEQKGGDEFWTKAETLLYTALIAYLHYESPPHEQNFSTLAEMIGAMEVREEDEEFKNIIDLMFDALAEKDPEHFAVRQYRKYKLAAGVICSKGLFNQSHKYLAVPHFVAQAADGRAYKKGGSGQDKPAVYLNTTEYRKGAKLYADS